MAAKFWTPLAASPLCWFSCAARAWQQVHIAGSKALKGGRHPALQEGFAGLWCIFDVRLP